MGSIPAPNIRDDNVIFLVYIHVYIWHIYCQNMEYHWQTKMELNVVSIDALEYALPE